MNRWMLINLAFPVALPTACGSDGAEAGTAYDPERVTPDRIAAVITAVGFDPVPGESGGNAP